MMWWVHVRGPHVKVRRQLCGVGSLYLYVGSGDQIQVRIIRHHQASQVSLDWGGSSKVAQTLSKTPPSLTILLVKLLKCHLFQGTSPQLMTMC